MRSRACASAFAIAVVTAACATPDRTQPMTPANAAPTAPHVDSTQDGVTLNPYHAVVRGKVLRAFEGLTAHDAEPALRVMAEDVHYTFEGDHALGGTRVSKEGVRKWFGRLLRLSPGSFVIRSVDVSGWPWSTRVVTTFEHYVAPPDREPYWGPGVQIADLEWGEAKRIRTYVDTAKLSSALDALAAAGVAEAVAPPILE